MSKKKICQPAQTCFLKNGPLISVVVPVYNMEKYLSRCLDSILRQTYENLEIIVVDDCSTDQSAKLIEQYMEQDERIKQITHEKTEDCFRRVSAVQILRQASILHSLTVTTIFLLIGSVHCSKKRRQ